MLGEASRGGQKIFERKCAAPLLALNLALVGRASLQAAPYIARAHCGSSGASSHRARHNPPWQSRRPLLSCARSMRTGLVILCLVGLLTPRLLAQAAAPELKESLRIESQDFVEFDTQTGFAV